MTQTISTHKNAQSYALAGMHALQHRTQAKGIVLLRLALKVDANCVIAHILLAAVYIRRGLGDSAREHLACVRPHLPTRSREWEVYDWLQIQLGDQPDRHHAPRHPDQKVCFRQVHKMNFHRSGWRYATDALAPLHHADGILFEDFLESPFSWENPDNPSTVIAHLWQTLRSIGLDNVPIERGAVPFREPWVGFLHNPQNMPNWYLPSRHPEKFFVDDAWQKSLSHCQGLFTLSEHSARWLRKQFDVPVSALIHPTEIPDVQFNWDSFVANENKKVIQVGWWLRQLSAIFRLPRPKGFTKIYLRPKYSSDSDERLLMLRQQECDEFGWDIDNLNETETVNYVPHHIYDEYLSQNVIFLKLYEAAANNAVIECIARATPLLVNRLPGVEEYLGCEYPLFYKDFDDARRKVEDFGRIKAAHQYLKSCPTRGKLSQEHFRQSFKDSEVYQRL